MNIRVSLYIFAFMVVLFVVLIWFMNIKLNSVIEDNEAMKKQMSELQNQMTSMNTRLANATIKTVPVRDIPKPIVRSTIDDSNL